MPEIKHYPVVKVVDGDTIDVDINGNIERLRLIGIDTPETVDPRKPVECFGVEASNKAKELLNGKMVSLEADPTQGERDKYNRLLRYVFLKDGTNFNKLMIKQGYAYEYTYSLPYKYQSEFKTAEAHARENKLGLWAPDACFEENKNEGENKEPDPAPVSSVVPPIAESNLKITYIFYDGNINPKEPDEYVEITNQGAPVNLKGHTLSDESGKTFTFPDVILETDNAIKIFTGCDKANADLYWCYTQSAVWNNGGDTATLKNPSGNMVDSYSYK